MLAEIAPDRTTLSQLSFFLFAALADKANRPATFTEIREATGNKIGKSLHTTYKIFLDGARRSDRPDGRGLNWLEREENPLDNREKLLRLTRKGDAIINELIEAMEAHG